MDLPCNSHTRTFTHPLTHSVNFSRLKVIQKSSYDSGIAFQCIIIVKEETDMIPQDLKNTCMPMVVYP